MIPSIDQLIARRVKLIEYMKMKIEEEDWHAVADASMDLREIDAKLSMIVDK